MSWAARATSRPSVWAIDWDTYYQHGKTTTHEQLTPTWNNARLALATDAVLSNGQIVCRSTITDPTNGCVPLNRFGQGVASKAALAYVMGTPYRDQEFTQDVAAFNFRTNDIQGWAGPISLATGAEYRKEKMSGFVEARYQSSGWKYGNFRATSGKYDVAEALCRSRGPAVQGGGLQRRLPRHRLQHLGHGQDLEGRRDLCADRRHQVPRLGLAPTSAPPI
jgi:iron complex outermembrane receptor protein